MFKNILFLNLMLIIIAGCETYRPQTMIEGEWFAYQGIQIMDGDNVNLSFHNNQFYYKYEQWSDVAIPCKNNPSLDEWTAKDYAEGIYEIKSNILTLKGKWLNKSCYNKGEFIAAYKYKILPMYFNSNKVRLKLINSENSNTRGVKKELLIIKK